MLRGMKINGEYRRVFRVNLKKLFGVEEEAKRPIIQLLKEEGPCPADKKEEVKKPEHIAVVEEPVVAAPVAMTEEVTPAIPEEKPKKRSIFKKKTTKK